MSNLRHLSFQRRSSKKSALAALLVGITALYWTFDKRSLGDSGFFVNDSIATPPHETAPASQMVSGSSAKVAPGLSKRFEAGLHKASQNTSVIHGSHSEPRLVIRDSQPNSGDSEEPVETMINPSVERDDAELRYAGEAPQRFRKHFGERSDQVWRAVQNEPKEHVQQSSLVVPIDPINNALEQKDSIQGKAEASSKTHETKAKQQPRYASWRLRDKCKTDFAKEERKLIGFVVKTFDASQRFLIQNFVEINPGDFSGCQNYKRPLAIFLPETAKEESFSGYLSVTGMLEGKVESDDLVWNNLVRPTSASTANQGSYSVTLDWDPSPDPDLVGYRFYFGQSSGKYTHVVDIGKAKTFQTWGLAAGTWYFSVTAYNNTGAESAFSNEVHVTLGPKNE